MTTFTNGNATKLAWEKLREDDTRLPKEVQAAVAAVAAAHDQLEAAVNKAKPAPKGRRWMFSYRYGVSVALADATARGTTSYWS